MPNTNKSTHTRAVYVTFFLSLIFILGFFLLSSISLAGSKNQQEQGRVTASNKKNKKFTPTPSPISTYMPVPSTSPTPSVTPDPQASPTPVPTPTPSSENQLQNWQIQSVSSMKESKDRVCGQRSPEFIDAWVKKAKELGANYIAVETPYDDPTCASAVTYTQTWVTAIRNNGMKVWHRHMPLAFEGIYDTPKSNQSDYLQLIASYIKAHPEFFADGDIFTPIPEPQNGGIAGITYCHGDVCQYTGAANFNQWLRESMTVSRQAFAEIGKNNMQIGFFGFDGFVAWGHNNPDWNGILEDQTITEMGNITIDHYPEIVGDTMENSLNELEARYPGVPIVIGEWGTISGTNYVEQVTATMQASKRPSVIGFNYWHLGVGGNEALINEDLSENVHFNSVESFFKPTL